MKTNHNMERMRAIIITILLFLSVVVAKDVGAGKVINPVHGPVHDPANGPVHDPAQYAEIDETANFAENAGISLSINQILNGQSKAYESPRFKRFVTHCSSHVAETCNGNNPMHHGGGINGPLGLSLCLFDSMEACLVDHKASLLQTSSSYKSQNSIQYLPVLIQIVKFQTVLRTCSHVTAQTCLTTSNVDTSALSACLKPSLIQCVYIDQTPPPPGMTYILSFTSLVNHRSYFDQPPLLVILPY